MPKLSVLLKRIQNFILRFFLKNKKKKSILPEKITEDSILKSIRISKYPNKIIENSNSRF